MHTHGKWASQSFIPNQILHRRSIPPAWMWRIRSTRVKKSSQDISRSDLEVSVMVDEQIHAKKTIISDSISFFLVLEPKMSMGIHVMFQMNMEMSTEVAHGHHSEPYCQTRPRHKDFCESNFWLSHQGEKLIQTFVTHLVRAPRDWEQATCRCRPAWWRWSFPEIWVDRQTARHIE